MFFPNTIIKILVYFAVVRMKRYIDKLLMLSQLRLTVTIFKVLMTWLIFIGAAKERITIGTLFIEKVEILLFFISIGGN